MLNIPRSNSLKLTYLKKLNCYITMASQEQIELSDFIKSIHERLRKDTRIKGTQIAWNHHCSNPQDLKKYSEAMHKLATKYWDKKEQTSKNESRNTWIYNMSILYFKKSELLKYRKKETEIINQMQLHIPNIKDSDYSNVNLKVLDVGSCYNPLKFYDCFEVTAIDIAPACDEVHHCDFLNITFSNSIPNNSDSPINEFQKGYFDIIVFSLFLEYLPSPQQRFLSCQTAYKLLKPEGILIIITPDSKHVNSNVKFVKSWRYVLAKMGFSRIKYEKLQYLHCMVFRKSLLNTYAVRWADMHQNEDLYEEIFIPQDFNSLKKEQFAADQERYISGHFEMDLLHEMPFDLMNS